jgi:hypothetical protein
MASFSLSAILQLKNVQIPIAHALQNFFTASNNSSNCKCEFPHGFSLHDPSWLSQGLPNLMDYSLMFPSTMLDEVSFTACVVRALT